MASERACLSVAPSSDQPVHSDDQPAPSSPPSSPPTYPWEQNTHSPTVSRSLAKPVASAFSVLGKRKALQPASENARPAKKPATTAKGEAKGLTQMQISLGQEMQKKCKVCGMEYIPSSPEDRKLHDKYHMQNAEGYDVGKDFLAKARDLTLFRGVASGDTIAAVDAFDNAWRKKRARAALDVVQRELGAVEIEDTRLWKYFPEHLGSFALVSQYTTYMYIRGTKCIGLLLAEQITEARRLVKPASTLKEESETARRKPTSTALEALRARRASSTPTMAASEPIELSKETCPAVLGISRIWTSPSHRGQGTALSLLDTALAHQNQRAFRNNQISSTEVSEALRPMLKDMAEITKSDVAFSQPTEAGTRLARKWYGTRYGWLVYVD